MGGLKPITTHWRTQTKKLKGKTQRHRTRSIRGGAQGAETGYGRKWELHSVKTTGFIYKFNDCIQ